MRRLRAVADHLPAKENSKPVPFYLQSGFRRAEHLLMVSRKNQKIGLPRSIPVTHGHTARRSRSAVEARAMFARHSSFLRRCGDQGRSKPHARAHLEQSQSGFGMGASPCPRVGPPQLGKRRRSASEPRTAHVPPRLRRERPGGKNRQPPDRRLLDVRLPIHSRPMRQTRVPFASRFSGTASEPNFRGAPGAAERHRMGVCRAYERE